MMAALLQVSSAEASIINQIYNEYSIDCVIESDVYKLILKVVDKVSSMLAGIDPILNNSLLCNRLEEAAKLRHFKILVGFTTTSATGNFIIKTVAETNKDIGYGSKNKSFTSINDEEVLDNI